MAQNISHKKRIAHAMALLTLVGVASSCAFVMTAVASGIVPSDVITLANSARIKSGLNPLHENTKLAQAAQAKADDMIKNDYFSHTSPKGVEPWYWIKQAGYQYKAAGENLAINYTDATNQHNAWMKSETHRANIMNTRYQDIGVAVVKGKINGKESIVTVEYFGTQLFAVADQAVPVPPVAVPDPVSIKGVEIETVAMPTPQAVKPLPVVTTPVTVSLELWLERIAFVWLLLSTVLVPLVFLSQTLRHLWVKQHRISLASEQGTVDIPVIAPIHIDGIRAH